MPISGARNRGARFRGDLIGAVDDVAFPLSLLAFVWFSALALRRQMVEPACLAIIVACGFIGNALLTSAASGVFDRYQARLSWLFLAAGVLVWARLRDAAIPASRPLIQSALAVLRLNPGLDKGMRRAVRRSRIDRYPIVIGGCGRGINEEHKFAARRGGGAKAPRGCGQIRAPSCRSGTSVVVPLAFAAIRRTQ